MSKQIYQKIGVIAALIIAGISLPTSVITFLRPPGTTTVVNNYYYNNTVVETYNNTIIEVYNNTLIYNNTIFEYTNQTKDTIFYITAAYNNYVNRPALQVFKDSISIIDLTSVGWGTSILLAI